MTRQIDKVRFSYLDLPRVVEWMIRGPYTIYNIPQGSNSTLSKMLVRRR